MNEYSTESTDTPGDTTTPTQPQRTSLGLLSLIVSLVVITLIIATAFVVFLATPFKDVFPTQFEVTAGMSVQEIAEKAAREQLVRSDFLLYTALSALHDPTNIHAGTYTFTDPANVLEVAAQIASMETELELVRVTFPEGIRAADMASIVADVSDSIDRADYEEQAQPYEGYLFPETYYIPPSMTAAELIILQRATFVENTEMLSLSNASSSLTERDVVTLASIVEREANDEESMRMVAGIFLNRLAIGMALQADASIEYVLDRPINELRAGELALNLRELDSPYNTYLYADLPPTPIGNPGLQALTAVVDPTPSPYLYYITGNDGRFYYAETLDQHNANIARYLR